MPGEDRDRAFEEALARHLRSSQPSAEPPSSAAPSSEAPVHQDTCPDAELLAAYHERSLTAEQMTSQRDHIAGCQRCQEILAELESTDEIALGATVEKARDVPLVNESPPAAESAAARLSESERPVVLDRTIQPLQITASRRTLNWRWLAPAGGLAASLLVWIAIHETATPPLKVIPKQQQAATPVSPRVPEPALPSQSGTPEKDQSYAANTGTTSEASSTPKTTDVNGKSSGDLKSKYELQGLPLNGRAITPLEEMSPSQGGQRAVRGGQNLSAAVATREADSNKSDLRDEGRLEAKERSKNEIAPAAPAPASADKPIPGVSGAVTLDQVSAAQKKAAAAEEDASRASVPQQEVAGAVPLRETPQALRLARSQTQPIVAAPNGRVKWRLGAGGLVEHSTDSGSTWTIQATDVVADLTAGSCISARVCWIVGHSATILRTIDGGAHWQKIPPPVDDDLVQVFAISAQQATITTASSRRTYKTDDGGITWNAVPSE